MKNSFLIISLFVMTCIGLISCESKDELENTASEKVPSDKENLAAEDLANYIVPDFRLINAREKRQPFSHMERTSRLI